MLYKLLGMLVWKGAKFELRRKYGPAMMPKPALAAIVVLGIGAVALASRSSGDE